jgi:hypothetical protein
VKLAEVASLKGEEALEGNASYHRDKDEGKYTNTRRASNTYP